MVDLTNFFGEIMDVTGMILPETGFDDFINYCVSRKGNGLIRRSFKTDLGPIDQIDAYMAFMDYLSQQQILS